MYQYIDLDYDADGFKASCAWAIDSSSAPACVSCMLAQRLDNAHLIVAAPYHPSLPPLQARFVNATNINWIVAWAACCAWQLAFVQQTPGGMWLALAAIVTAFGAMGRALLQLYRWVWRRAGGARCDSQQLVPVAGQASFWQRS